MSETTEINQRILRDSLPLELKLLLELTGVDWSGKSIGKGPFYSQAAPKLRPGSRVYSMLIDGISKVEASLKPADQFEVLQMLSQLRLHFPTAWMSEREMILLLQDYMVDLAEYPADILEQVIVDYRRGDNLYFPKIGQLLKLAKKYLYQRQTKLKRLRKILEVSGE